MFCLQINIYIIYYVIFKILSYQSYGHYALPKYNNLYVYKHPIVSNPSIKVIYDWILNTPKQTLLYYNF